MCVELSEQEIGEAIPAPSEGWTDDTDGHAPLKELISQLMRRDAAIWVFVETIQDLYGPCALLESVRAAVRAILAEPVLTRAERQAVHRMCANLACSDVATLFRLSVGSLGHVLKSETDNLCAVLNELENLAVRADGLHPIVAFVEYLAKEQPPEGADQLRRWTESRAGTRTPLVQALHKIRNETEPPEDVAPKYCVVQLDADGIESDRFLVSLLFQEGTEQPEPLRAPDDRVYARDQVRALISTLLNEPRLAGAEDLTFEFVLPTQLINEPVDQWRVGFGGFALGLRYPVVVRSLDRVRHVRDSFAIWRSSWASFGAAQFQLNDPAVGWISAQAQENRDQLYATLATAAAPACLLLEVAPVPEKCNALITALQAGKPALLWCRHAAVDIRAALAALMAQAAPLRELPHHIFEFRRRSVSAGAGEGDLAHHLTLLWDDADRIPNADSPLCMPG